MPGTVACKQNYSVGVERLLPCFRKSPVRCKRVILSVILPLVGCHAYSVSFASFIVSHCQTVLFFNQSPVPSFIFEVKVTGINIFCINRFPPININTNGPRSRVRNDVSIRVSVWIVVPASDQNCAFSSTHFLVVSVLSGSVFSVGSDVAFCPTVS